MKLQLAEYTHIGGRDSNQDYFVHVLEDDWAMFAVADGLGGHDCGELASKYYLEALVSLIPKYAKEIIATPAMGLEALIEKASLDFKKRVEQDCPGKDPQTTLALVWFDKNHLVTAHIGYSRIYRIQDKEIVWRTPDHTMVQKLYEESKISEEEMAEHPMQNRLLNSISIFEAPKPDIFIHPPIEKGEVILACTDGFWGAFEEPDLTPLLTGNGYKKKLSEFVEAIAAEDPDSDNITVQLIKCTQMP